MMPNTKSLRRWSQNEGKCDVAHSANVTLSKVVSRERRTSVAHRTHQSRKPGKRSQGSSALQPAQTLTEQAYRLIVEQIVTLRLKPGEILSEQGLSATIRIGRTPIREALQRLAREGLVTILPRKGILVSDINPRH